MSVDALRQKFYAPDRLDNDVVFRDMLYEIVKPGMRVLDAGAGAGDLFRYDLKARAGEVIGVDLDPRVEGNPQIHRGIQANLEDMPVESGSCDIVFSRYVLEHVAEPKNFLSEVSRVLKEGGHFLFLTPNKWHYVALGARLTPHAFHDWFNRKRGRDDSDTFPTFYRLNSARDLRRHLITCGFCEESLHLRECCPNYLSFSVPSFLLGVAYERLVTAIPAFACFRVNLLGDFVKAGEGEARR